MPRFLQITVGADAEGNECLFGLEESGQVWRFCGAYERRIEWPGRPTGAGDTMSVSVRAKFTDGWEKINMDVVKPEALTYVYKTNDKTNHDGRVPTADEKQEFITWLESFKQRGR